MGINRIACKALFCPMPSEVTFLETCSALLLGENNDVPEWVMLLPAGVSRGVDGRGPYNNDQPEVVVNAFMADGRPLAFDYNHQTVFAALNGQNSPAAGWIDKLEVREGAIWGHVDWTDGGRTALAAREYRFVSPVFKHEKSGRVTAMVSSALVNSPNLRELPAINAQIRAIFPKTGDAKPMDEELRARLAAALGQSANTSIEALIVHAETNRTATGAPDPALYVPMAAFSELQTTVAKLQDTATSTHATNLVDAASKAGKLTPALREWGLDYASQNPAAFEKWAKDAPVILAGGVDPKLADVEIVSMHASGLMPDELAVCTVLGIKPEDYAISKKGV